MANKKIVGAAAMAAALAGGGALGALLGTPVISGAQTEDPTTTTAAPEDSTSTTTAPESSESDSTEKDGDGHFGHHGRGHFGRIFDLAVAADALGITEDELRTALQDGQSIAEVATANNVDIQTVIDAVVADATAEIDEKLADGDIDQTRADELKANLTERITDLVNRDGLPGGHGPGGFGGHGHR
jgi:hypothetical protein